MNEARSHPRHTVFAAYLRGRKSGGVAIDKALEAHVESCNLCRVVRAGLNAYIAREQSSAASQSEKDKKDKKEESS